MTKIFRKFAMIALLLAGVLAAPAYAGGGGSLFLAINLKVNVNPVQLPAPVVAGDFTYGVTCVSSGGSLNPPFTFPSPATTFSFPPRNGLTPISEFGFFSSNPLETPPVANDCTYTQLTRPTPPPGYVWKGAPASVVQTNIQGEAPFAEFANVLTPAFNVTTAVSPAGGGGVTCTPANPIALGDSATCSAAANTGYTFANFSTDSCGANSTSNPFTTSPLTANCVVTGNFTLNTYTVNGVANPTAGGSVTCVPSTVNHGATASCTAAAATGYTLTGFTTSGCGAASSSNPFVTNAVTANCTVTGAFSLNTYTVTGVANPSAGGGVTCVPSTVNHGATASCTAAAATGYTLTGFTTSGCGAASSTNPFVTNAITANCTVTGAFSLNTYSVTGVASPVAGGAVTCASPVSFNATSACTATANTGYRLTGISGCGGTGVSTSPYTTGAVTANCTVTATFVLNTITITTVAVPTVGGTLTCTPNPVTFGSTSTCTATPNIGYVIAPFVASALAGKAISPAASGGISGCGGVGSSTNTFTTGIITSACTVTANFVLIAVPVTTLAISASGGVVTCAPNPVPFGSAATCTAAANAGFTLTSISGCGGVTTTTSPFVTGAVTAACTVTGSFTPVVVPMVGVPVPTLDGWALLLLILLTVGIAMLCFPIRSWRQ